MILVRHSAIVIGQLADGSPAGSSFSQSSGIARRFHRVTESRSSSTPPPDPDAFPLPFVPRLFPLIPCHSSLIRSTTEHQESMEDVLLPSQLHERILCVQSPDRSGGCIRKYISPRRFSTQSVASNAIDALDAFITSIITYHATIGRYDTVVTMVTMVTMAIYDRAS